MSSNLGSINRIVFVKDPTVLPDSVTHYETVESLAKVNKLVILLSHGNKYLFPKGWDLPKNVRLLEYDLDMPSIQAAVRKLRLILHEHDVEVQSRHLAFQDALPIVLSGALVSVPQGTELAFLNGKKDAQVHRVFDTPTIQINTEWDIL